MYEEFYTSSDYVNFHEFKSIGVIKNSKKLTYNQIDSMIKKINSAFDKDKVNKKDIVKTFGEILNGFDHKETGKTLDQKM